MCAAGLYSACSVPSPEVQDKQESNGIDLQKSSELLQPVHGLPLKKVEGDACDPGSFSCWAVCSPSNRA